MFFLIYGFGGFVLENIFGTIINKKKTRREGFLTNYFCPLYGLCGIVIIQLFTICDISFSNRFIALLAATISSITAVTFFEYVVGFTLDKIFHHKMWDYTENYFNLHSYICLEFSLIWGIIAITLSSFIHPIIEILVLAIPETINYFIVAFTLSLILINSSYNMRKNYHFHNFRL
jgi:uncharacterized membrane protein